jgi:50S ribosomal protein L16 3-hydroxylase
MANAHAAATRSRSAHGAPPASAVETLLGTTPDALVREHWTERPLHRDAPPDRLARWLDVPELSGVEALLAAHRGHPTRVAIAAADGAHHEARVETEEAERLWRSGRASLCLDFVDRHLPTVRDLLDRVAAEVGIAPSEALCNAYASPPGHGIGQHFDSQEVLVVQVLGEKEWEVASAAYCARWPRSNHVAGTASPPLDGPGVPHPALMPPGSLRVAMRPGSALFLPRGTWHRTEASAAGASLSLTLTFTPPTWGDLALRLLASANEEAWREPAVGARDPRFDARSRERLSATLAALRGRCDAGAGPRTVASILARMDAGPASAGSVFALARGPVSVTRDGDDRVVSVAGVEVSVDGATAAGVEAALAAGRAAATFSPEEVARLAPALSLPQARAVVGMLLAVGAVRAAGRPGAGP